LTDLGAQTTTPLNLQNCLGSYLSISGKSFYLKKLPQGQLVDNKSRLFSMPITTACANSPSLQRVLVKLGPNELVQYVRFDFSQNNGEIISQFDGKSQLAIYAQIQRSSEKVAFHPFALYPQNPASLMTYVVVMKNSHYMESVSYGGISREEQNE
jgi:hypothetical protein